LANLVGRISHNESSVHGHESFKLKKNTHTQKLIMVHDKIQCWKTQYRWTDQISVFKEAVVRSTYFKN